MHTATAKHGAQQLDTLFHQGGNQNNRVACSIERDLAPLGDVGKPSAAEEFKRQIFTFKSCGQTRNHSDVVRSLTELPVLQIAQDRSLRKALHQELFSTFRRSSTFAGCQPHLTGEPSSSSQLIFSAAGRLSKAFAAL